MEESKSTVEVEFCSKLIDFNLHKIKIQLWETEGQEKYKS